MSDVFKVHMLNDEGKAKARLLAANFEDFHKSIQFLCEGPNGGARELAIVRTKLEEACFFAKKAMAMQDVNQEVPE